MLIPVPLSHAHTHTRAYTHNFDNAVLIVSVCMAILMCHSNVFSSASFPLTAFYHNKQHKCLFHCSPPLLLMQMAFAWSPVASQALPVLRNTWQFMRLHTHWGYRLDRGLNTESEWSCHCCWKWIPHVRCAVSARAHRTCPYSHYSWSNVMTSWASSRKKKKKVNFWTAVLSSCPYNFFSPKLINVKLVKKWWENSD